MNKQKKFQFFDLAFHVHIVVPLATAGRAANYGLVHDLQVPGRLARRASNSGTSSFRVAKAKHFEIAT